MALGYVAGDEQLRSMVVVAVSSSNTSSQSSLIDLNTYGSAGFVVGIAALAIIMELLFIIVRICNIGLINLKVKIFLIIVSIPEVVHAASCSHNIILCGVCTGPTH